VYGDLWQRHPGDELTVAAGLDLAVAAGTGAARLARAVIGRPLAATAAGALRLGGRALLDGSGHPVLAGLANRGEMVRATCERAAAEAVSGVLRRAVEWAATSLDLTELVRAHVDLDALAAELDVDAVIARADVDAVIARTDLDAIVRTIDLDAIVGRIDIEAIVKTIDLDAIVKTVDLEAIVDRVDLDRVASRIDIDAIISRVDIDQIASGIDLDAIVARIEPDTVVARVDVEAVLDRLDLAAIARQVLEAIDLPGILRESTGAVSSQAARVVRTEGMHADESVSRFIDRVLRRSHTQAAVTP
jgi:hypothetical protein